MDFEIVHFRPEHESQVVDLLTALWEHDRETRARLFRWKYLENPSSDRPLGIVALHGDRVVGFRGYFANRFVLEGHDGDVVILHPGDTCVDPEYRKLGLSVAMGNKAMDYDRARYRLLMNMTCSTNSLPGYLKLGFRPLADKIHLKWHSMGALGWLMNRLARGRPASATSRVEHGRFGDVLVSHTPRPADMAAIISDQRNAGRALRPCQDRAFFAWRYANPAHRYAFYFLMEGSAARGYVAIDIKNDNRSGEILDYGRRDDQALHELMAYIVRSRHFDILSIYSYGADDLMARVLAEFGFEATNPLQRLYGRARSIEASALPLLIRPVGYAPAERDYFIDGVDVRSPANWGLKPICSDAA